MPKFRKKPVVIDAVQWTGGDEYCENYREIKLFTKSAAYMAGDGLRIRNFEGPTLAAKAGDWIIRGLAGEFYPCKPAIFDASHEAVEKEGGTSKA